MKKSFFILFLGLVISGLILLSNLMSDKSVSDLETKNQEIKKSADISLLFSTTTAISSSSSVSPLIEKSSSTSSIIFVGDIMLSRSVGKKIVKNDDPKYPFLKVAEILQSADLTFGNLENPVSDKGQDVGSIYSFRADPVVIQGLKFAGFDVLSLANNHMWDWGHYALEDTITLLKNNDISPIGAGWNFTEANTPVIKNVGNAKVAFLAYSTLYPRTLSATAVRPGVSYFEMESIKKNILNTRAFSDLVVVSFHWGEEYETEANDEQVSIAHALIDAGADLVIGHHPHVIQNIEKYKDKWIAYSLGNFVFDQTFSEATRLGLIFRAEIKDRKISDVKLSKVRINNNFQPQLIEDD